MSTLRITVISGGRAGRIFRFSTPAAGVRSGSLRIGRAPDAEIQLDPQQDLRVSSEHALISWDGRGWVVRDAGSTNGTLVNGVPVHAIVRLAQGDRIRLGASGPVLRFELEGVASPLEPRAESAAPAASMESGEPPELSKSHGARSTGHPLRWAATGGIAVLLVVLAIVLVPLQRERAQVRRLTERLDSIERASGAVIAGLQNRVSGLQAALESSRGELRDLGDDLQLARRSGDREAADRLGTRLEAATEELGRLEAAAGLDFERVVALNRAALAEVFVELAPGEVLTATAFAVRPDGLLLTNRHVVEQVATRGGRIAVQFSGSEQVWPAEVASLSDEVDLAALRVQGVLGDVPVLAGFHRRSDTIPVGMPVIVLGFPLGGVSPNASRSEAAVGAGTVRAALPGQLQVDGYGAPGASGSPVLDAEGLLVGVVRGGEERSDGTTLVAVPSSVVLRFVENVAALERASGG